MADETVIVIKARDEATAKLKAAGQAAQAAANAAASGAASFAKATVDASSSVDSSAKATVRFVDAIKKQIVSLVSATKATEDQTDASGDMARETDKASKAFDAMGKAANAARAGVNAAGKAFAASVAVFTASSAIAAKFATEQDAAERKRALAMARAGTFTMDAHKANLAYASSLQDVTTVGDETTLELLSLADTMNLTGEAGQKAVAAAIDMGAALGRDPQTIIANMGKTLGGLTGELGELVPELKSLTKEQLESGAAVDLIAAKFKGFAASEAKTFGGRMKQLKNSTGDFAETLGFFITRSSVFNKAAEGMNGFVKDLTDVVNRNRKTIAIWIRDGITLVIRAVGAFIDRVASAPLAFVELKQVMHDTIDSMLADLESLMRAMSDLPLGVGTAAKTYLKSIQSMRAGLAGWDSDINESRSDAFAWKSELDQLTASIEATAAAIAAADVDSLISDSAISEAEQLRLELESLLEQKQRLEKSNNEKPEQPDSDDGGASFAGTVAVSIGGKLEGVMAAVGSAVASGLETMAKNTKDASKKALLMGAAQFAPVVATGLSALSTFLRSGFDETVKDFADSLVKIGENLGPVLVAIVENLDEIVFGLVRGVSKAFVSLFKSMPRLFMSLFRSFGDMMLAALRAFYGKEIMDTIEDAIADMWSKLKRFIGGLFVDIGDWIGGIFDDSVRALKKSWFKFMNGLISLANFFIDLYNAIPFVSDIARIQKYDLSQFAEGGIVGGPMGAPVPVIAHAGEMVLNGSQQSRLMDLLNGQGSTPQPAPVTVEVVERRESDGEFAARVRTALRTLQATGDIRLVGASA